MDLAFHMCGTQELVRPSHSARLASVQTARGSSACVNTDIWTRSHVRVNVGLRGNSNITCKCVSYGRSLASYG